MPDNINNFLLRLIIVTSNCITMRLCQNVAWSKLCLSEKESYGMWPHYKDVVGMGSMGSAEPINFEKRVLVTNNFLGIE